MAKGEWQLRERALTLYSTGRYASRQDAMIAARLERKRSLAKKKEREVLKAGFIPFSEDGD